MYLQDSNPFKRNIKTLRYADDTTVTAESEEQLKKLMMRAKKELKKLSVSGSVVSDSLRSHGL